MRFFVCHLKYTSPTPKSDITLVSDDLNEAVHYWITHEVDPDGWKLRKCMVLKCPLTKKSQVFLQSFNIKISISG